MSWFFLATPLGKKEKTSETAAFKTLKEDAVGTGSKALAEINAVKFDKSKFKIGTLDQLVNLNDALVKVDHHLETIIRKIQKQAEEISPDMKLKVETNEGKAEIPDFIESFQWDDTKYPRSRALKDIAANISEKMNSIDSDMKKSIDEYNNLKNQLSQYKKKEDGNFMARDPGDIVYGKIAKSNFIHDSKFMKNVLIIVPKNKIEHFQKTYESVGEGVVPRSARQLHQKDPAQGDREIPTEDKDGNNLFRVVVMENSADTFVLKCKQKTGFSAKLFSYDEEGYLKDIEEAKSLESKLNKLTTKLEKRCYFSYSELYISSIHLKVMRSYIDGVLRFGIPPRFLLTVIHCKHGNEKKLLKNLTDLFADPKMKGMYGTKEEIGDTEDFFPFVYVPISTI